MTLTHDTYTFENANHGLIREVGPQVAEIVRETFAGVLGEFHLIDETKGGDLACPITLDGYATRAMLKTARDTIASKRGKLTGSLTDAVETYAKCTFAGYLALEDPGFDGSGVHNWHQDLLLFWTQRSRS